MPAVKQYANSHYLAGARPFAVKLIEDIILQTPVYREEVIIDKSDTTYGDLESQADILLNERSDGSCVISMPFLLLQWLTTSTKCLQSPAIILLRKLFEFDGRRITWQDFEVFVAIFDAVKTMLFHQRESRNTNGAPVIMNLAKYFNIKDPTTYLNSLNIILPSNVDVCTSKQQFPKKTSIKDVRAGRSIKWDNDSCPMIVNGTGAEFADVFMVRGIKNVDEKVDGRLLLCSQCKLYSEKRLTKTDAEDENKKIFGALKKHLSRYSYKWLLVIYNTQIINYRIDNPRCIILDSIGMERHFGPTMAERAFYLLEHRKVNANFFDADELQQARGIGDTYASLIVEERKKSSFKD
ncbi:hypothetical protein RhiirA4_469418 [Rhizophagus irregularis]|uniref:Uncharacterized protein n=1 Tax=Rhizophagus irregularis TaxID=588596 RepID=A0A2I1GZH7_9GLOM|nr:hypothetical protein RhiirA4_469418 [Rhizophagus irregularis]